MNILKTIIAIACVTAVALTYVHQQVELVKLSYAIERKERIINDIVDRNGRLGYNIGNLETPSRLENALLSKKIEVAFPKKGNVVLTGKGTLRYRNEAAVRSHGVERKSPILGIVDFFLQSREAQAKE